MPYCSLYTRLVGGAGKPTKGNFDYLGLADFTELTKYTAGPQTQNLKTGLTTAINCRRNPRT